MEIIREPDDFKDIVAKYEKRSAEQKTRAFERKGAKTEAEWQKTTLDALKMQQSRHPKVKITDHRIKVDAELKAVQEFKTEKEREIEENRRALTSKADNVAKRAFPKVVMGKIPGTTPGSPSAPAA
ncbi:MAG: hypothetical protein K1000chlam4_00295 [Chlamydiae bacterium]|nr:hypothetical protein [Chlamydiota bacterium]